MRIKMRSFLVFLLIVLCISTASSTVAAYDRISAKDQQCISLTNEQTAALVARDWENLERLSKNYLVECGGFVTPEVLSSGAVNIPMANNALGRYKQALRTADECVKIYYGNPGCHIQKAQALFALGNKPDAIVVLEISGKIARHALEGAKHDLERARSEGKKELHRSSVYLYESQLRHIDALRKQFE